ncbi:hypothetical protein GCM10011583_18170 [Streptomyces camponoticapitis]|uniref:DUF6919 domain-containing protein n=1 Tax=Streptomyces camponoticapitis TaxID=1616125 RepID=A0ABQ2E254_9ACTN|nr:hypothetical protein [Streptomyces camponoticapitis]GGJ86930.1 hypothetical protein GCM10011583_18170 [Streptomyces camponoticapitis]
MPLPWMSRRDRRAWRTASTLADLGELTARWLEGDLKSQAGYQPRYGPDEETAELIPTLAAACRAGFLTDNSQPGEDETAAGVRWQQRAAVDGYLTDLDLLSRIRAAAKAEGVLLVVNQPGGRARQGIPATKADGETYTWFGRAPTRADRRISWDGVSRAAHREIAAARHVTLIDPEWGRNDRLWPLLDQITNRVQIGV